jgi:hypothetical protein
MFVSKLLLSLSLVGLSFSVAHAKVKRQQSGVTTAGAIGGSRPVLSAEAQACVTALFAELKVIRDEQHACASSILSAQAIDPAAGKAAFQGLSEDVKAQLEACKVAGPSREEVSAKVKECGV